MVLGWVATTAWMMALSKTAKHQEAKKVAIIGGGASGLAAARILQRQATITSEAAKITIFEKDAHVGGVWNYEAGNPTKPMYQGLRTNLPKEIMAFREFPWPELQESFLTHQQVQTYLGQYADRFDLHQYLQPSCCVDQLTVLPQEKSLASQNEETWPKISLKWHSVGKSSNDITTEEDVFDAVFVCNGHYSLPRIPNIPGLREHFRGTIVHSIEYDTPSTYAGQRVLCVGGRASGSDIAREIATQPETMVYLSDTTFKAPQPITEYNVTWTSATTSILSDGRVAFQAAGTDPVAFDTIIFCSGYDYDFPFINEHSGVTLEARSRRCTPLFEQLWHAEYPNIAFVGLPHSVLPFPLFEFQAEAVVKSWTDSVLPSLSVRTKHAAAAAVSGGQGKENGRVPDDTHYLGSAQWDYCRQLARYAGLLDETVERYISMNQTIYEHTGEQRQGSFIAGPDLYRSVRYKRLGDKPTVAGIVLNPNPV